MLRIGKIDYANLYPIYHYLENIENSGYEFISGVPSKINSMIREGIIDICPASSIEYLRYPERYLLIESHSVSSIGEVKSILLLSNKKIGDLSGKTVLISAQSETSQALLKIILKKFYNIDASFHISNLSLDYGLQEQSAYMLIGDDALIANFQIEKSGILIKENFENNNSAIPNPLEASPKAGLSKRVYAESHRQSKIYVYDLGKIWHDNTGLPFVFALWIARKEFLEKSESQNQKSKIFERFRDDLNNAKHKAAKDLKNIALNSHYTKLFSQATLISYWESISYDLTKKHYEGLRLFDVYLRELNLLY